MDHTWTQDNYFWWKAAHTGHESVTWGQAMTHGIPQQQWMMERLTAKRDVIDNGLASVVII